MSHRKNRRASERPAASPPADSGAPPAFRPQGIERAFPLAIVGAIFLVYANAFVCPFIFDDVPGITENETIRSLWPIGRAFWGPDETPVAGRPIVNFSFALNHAISGYAVWSYHLFNIAIHAGAALALYGIGRRTLLLPRLRERWGALAGRGGFALALLWALHPIQTQSVTYLTARNESLMGLFCLLTLYGFVRAVDAPRPRRWHALSWCACLLGMASKETMATAPVLVLLFDGCFVAGSWGEVLRKRWKVHASLAATWILLGALMATGPRQATTGLGFKLTPVDYLKMEGRVILAYFKLSLWPHPLVFDYGWYKTISWGRAVFPVLAVAGMVAASVAALRLRPGLGFLGTSIFLILAPTSSVMPISEPMWEYRMYLPLASVLALALLAARALWVKLPVLTSMAAVRRRRLAISVLAALALLYGGLTFARNRDYRSEFILLKDTVAKVPDNARAVGNLGLQLMKMGRVEEATLYFAESARLRPGYANAHMSLGTALMRLGRPEEARPSLERAVAIDPRHAKARNNLGVLRIQERDYPAAIAEFEAAIDARPRWIQPRLNRCVALASSGRRDEADAAFAETRRLFPGAPEIPASLDQLLASPEG